MRLSLHNSTEPAAPLEVLGLAAVTDHLEQMHRQAESQHFELASAEAPEAASAFSLFLNRVRERNLSLDAQTLDAGVSLLSPCCRTPTSPTVTLLGWSLFVLTRPSTYPTYSSGFSWLLQKHWSGCATLAINLCSFTL